MQGSAELQGRLMLKREWRLAVAGGLHCQSALGRISIVHREYQPISYHPGQEDFTADQKTVLLIPLGGGSKDQRMLEWEICVISDLIYPCASRYVLFVGKHSRCLPAIISQGHLVTVTCTLSFKS